MLEVLGFVILLCLNVLAVMGTAWVVRQIVKGWQQMALVTKELLEAKLTTWTLSSQVHKVLGFTDEQEAAVKLELNTLAELGIVDRDGARRGLKFRLAGVPEPEPSDEDDIKVDSSVQGYIRVRDSLKTSTKDKNFFELLEWITNVSVDRDPYLTSMGLVIKKCADGSIVLRAHSGCLPLMERHFGNSDAFAKFILKSITPKTNTKESN